MLKSCQVLWILINRLMGFLFVHGVLIIFLPSATTKPWWWVAQYLSSSLIVLETPNTLDIQDVDTLLTPPLWYPTNFPHHYQTQTQTQTQKPRI